MSAEQKPHNLPESEERGHPARARRPVKDPASGRSASDTPPAPPKPHQERHEEAFALAAQYDMEAIPLALEYLNLIEQFDDVAAELRVAQAQIAELTRDGGGDSIHLRIASEARERMHVAEDEAASLKEQYAALERERNEYHENNELLRESIDDIRADLHAEQKDYAAHRERYERLKEQFDALRSIALKLYESHKPVMLDEWDELYEFLAFVRDSSPAGIAPSGSGGEPQGPDQPGETDPNPAMSHAGVPPGDRSPIGREAPGDDAGEPRGSNQEGSPHS